MIGTRGPRGTGRFRPLLGVGFLALALPVALLAGPGGDPDVVGLSVVVLVMVAAILAWGVGPRLGGRERELVGTVLGFAFAVALGLVALRTEVGPLTLMPVVAALAVSLGLVAGSSRRRAMQGLLVGGAAAILVTTEPAPSSAAGAVTVLVPVVLLLAVTVLGESLASEVDGTRRAHARARRDADRRADLLRAVQALSGAEPEQAAQVTVEALRRAGFDATGVLVRQGALLLPLAISGLEDALRSRVDEGIAGQALREDRTIVTADYAREPRSLEYRRHLGAAVVAPIRVEGRPNGIVFAARELQGAPSPDEVEVVEVLADHLGGAVTAARRVRTQEQMLARLRQLDALRSAFIGRVSVDLRDPLSVIRAAANTLEVHGSSISDEERERTLALLTDRSTDLFHTVEALLDVARLHAQRPDPDIGAHDLRELLSTALTGEGVTAHLRTTAQVLVDPVLVRHGIELLRRAGLARHAPVRIDEQGPQIAVILRLRALDTADGRLIVALAERLLLPAGVVLAVEGREVLRLRFERARARTGDGP